MTRRCSLGRHLVAAPPALGIRGLVLPRYVDAVRAPHPVLLEADAAGIAERALVPAVAPVGSVGRAAGGALLAAGGGLGHSRLGQLLGARAPG